MTPAQALKKLRNIAKNNTELAAWAKRSRQAVSNWRKVPAECVLDIERHSGMSRHELRQDIYGPSK